MHSLQAELQQLHAEGALDAPELRQATALEERTLFSLYDELRAALYAAVALIVTGVGIVVGKHLDRIGPLTLALLLLLAAAACYAPAARARRLGTARSAASDYLALLGALLISVDLGYAESQFHWLGTHWSRHLLLLAALHAMTAYALDSRLVLSVALTALAGWFGIEHGPGLWAPWHLDTPALGLRALICAAVMLAWRAVDQRMHRARFREVFDHFATNLAFWGALCWCADSHVRLMGIAALLVLSWGAISTALRSGMELFAVYGVVYSALGGCIVIEQFLPSTTLAGAAAVLAVVLTAAAALRYLHDRLRRTHPCG
jgi:asparagine N-glycosylation enzyme membrane subunit Stt3